MKKFTILCFSILTLWGCTDTTDLQQEQFTQYTESYEEAMELVVQNEWQSAKTILIDLEKSLNSLETASPLLEDVKNELAKVEDQLSVQQVNNQQLANVITDLYSRYGIVPENHEYHARGELLMGLVYSDLIDFNQDGQDELYVLFKSSEYMNDELERRNQNGYIEEVWGVSDGKAELLWDSFYTIDESVASDLSVSLITLNDGTTAIKHSSEMTKQGIEFAHHQFYTLQEHEISLAHDFYYTKNLNVETEKPYYEVNTKEVDQQKYTKEFQSYNGNELPLIQSNIGEKSFGIDLTNPMATIETVVTNLTKDASETLFSNEEISLDKKGEHFIQQFNNVGKIDKRESTTYETMIAYILFNNILEANVPGEYGEGYREKSVLKAVKDYFNVDVNPNRLNIPTELDPTHWMYLQNDAFYLAPSGYYNPKVIRNVEKVVKVKETLYYVQVQDYNFNSMEHNLNTGIDFNFEKYKKLPLEQWPAHTKPYIEKELPTYMLLNYDGDQYQLYYQGHLTLFDGEIEGF